MGAEKTVWETEAQEATCRARSLATHRKLVGWPRSRKMRLVVHVKSILEIRTADTIRTGKPAKQDTVG